jgi:hypothetical protein
MGKGYYIVSAVLLGVGGYLLYTKIKKGNISFNSRNEDSVVQVEDGSHLTPPMEVTPTIPSLATPKFV